ncbi:MAG: hypothetical protein AABY84_00585 [Candidatus Firestonebacteria bacterium]
MGLRNLSSPQNINVIMVKNNISKYKIEPALDFFTETIDPYITNENTKKYCKEKKVKRLKCQNSMNL